MLLLGRTRTRQEVVEHMEVPLPRGHVCYPASLQSMVQEFGPKQKRLRRGSRVILELQEKPGLGCRGRRGRLGGRERVEHVGSKRHLVR